MDSVSERVFAIVLARLGAIKPDDSFNTDAGARVFRGKRSPDVTDCPCIVLWDDGETPDKETGNNRAMSVSQRLLIIGHVAAGAEDGGAMAGHLKADIKRALFQSAPLADDDGSIGELFYKGATTSAREDGADTEYVSVNAEAKYREVIGNPYSTKVIRE